MKTLLTFITILFSISCSYAQQEHEILYAVYQTRGSIDDDFEDAEIEKVIGILDFKSDSSLLFSVRGDFSGWGERGWIIMGITESKKLGLNGEFNQLIFPVMDLKDKQIVIASFIVGPFKYPDELYLPKDELLFEMTFLYQTKRYTFIGIYTR